ncbi:MAG: DUF6263 family protein [Planctomycetia bacterium]|nr:DUF6263 family protein [Planctomycetia bacterium]
MDRLFKKIWFFGLAFLCMIVFAGENDLFAQETFRIEHTFPVPGKYLMNVKSATEMITHLGQKETPNLTDQDQTWSYTVDPEKDGKQVIRLQLNKFAMTSKINDQQVLDFESGNPAKQNELLTPMYDAMIKSEILCRTENGKPVGLEGFDQMWERMEKDSKPETKAMLEMIKKQMSDHQFTEILLMSVKFFPRGRDVKTGDTWDVDFDQNVPMIGNMKGKTLCTLKNVEVKDGLHIAVIETKGEIASGENSSASIPGAPSISLKKVNVKIEGSIEYVFETGVVPKNISTNIMEMEMEMPVPGNAEKITLSVSGKTQSTVLMKKAEN